MPKSVMIDISCLFYIILAPFWNCGLLDLAGIACCHLLKAPALGVTTVKPLVQVLEGEDL